MIHEAGIKDKTVSLALPESQVFTRIIDIPALSDEELESALKWQAEQYIPLPLADVTMDFSILKRPLSKNEKMQVLLVAAPNRVIEKYSRILDRADLIARAMETEVIAASRVCSKYARANQSMIILDFGSKTTDVAVLKEGYVMLAHVIPIGGEAFTRSISENFSLEILQAEEYKKAYGLDQAQLQGKVFNVIKPIMDNIIQELRKTLTFYTDKHGSEVKQIMLYGGSALMPGLVSYLAQHLELEVQIANAWESMVIPETVDASSSISAQYLVATGLALRDLE
jgi:type IV pilus assembly protein PilM